MKILSITAQKPNSTGSGVYLSELVKGFGGLQVEQAVAAGVEKADLVSIPEGVKYYPVYYRTSEMPFAVLGMSDEMPYASTRYRDLTSEMLLQFQHTFLKRIREAVDEFQPDVILCHHLYLLTAFVREAFPKHCVVGICHGTGLRQMKKIPLERDYIREQTQRLSKIFALTAVQKTEIVKTYGVKPEQVEVIGSGYNAEVFWNRQLPKNRERVSFIFAGKLSEKKGVMSLLRSLAQISGEVFPPELFLAGGYGDEEEYQTICRLATKQPYPVHILGKLTQQELANRFNTCDIFVLPSFYEGLPLVLLEAMACGLTVICTDLPGIKEWMDEQLPGNKILYAAPPGFRNADEPKQEELPLFEQRLAAAARAACRKRESAVDVTHLSWKSVCGKIIEIMKHI